MARGNLISRITSVTASPCPVRSADRLSPGPKPAGPVRSDRTNSTSTDSEGDEKARGVIAVLDLGPRGHFGQRLHDMGRAADPVGTADRHRVPASCQAAQARGGAGFPRTVEAPG
jgi:hypothetical protein